MVTLKTMLFMILTVSMKHKETHKKIFWQLLFYLDYKGHLILTKISIIRVFKKTKRLIFFLITFIVFNVVLYCVGIYGKVSKQYLKYLRRKVNFTESNFKVKPTSVLIDKCADNLILCQVIFIRTRLDIGQQWLC